MNTRKFFTWLAVITCFAFIIAPLVAQVTNTPGTNLPPVIPGTEGLPLGKDAIWLALIAPITFSITWLVGKIPKLPKAILPWLTPVAGIAIGLVMQWATKANWPWWSSAGAGMIATTLYEAIKGVTGAGPQSALTPTPKPPKP